MKVEIKNMLTFLSEAPVNSMCFAVAPPAKLGGWVVDRVAAKNDPIRDKVGTVWH